ncbi:hypothetical protein BP6252_03406 [Coleophoma cylindrospora]|uniref:Uncharacterized protein n=1 Tax=Coleophoma cylindrospora TaxID=1849047 RepID=A0A3D8S889_9HELO|nr:hypothetical protein BP6252_03406 [Coleophoma cylindrospora]
MAITISTYRGSASGEISRKSTSRPDLSDFEVFVKTTHSGVCGTDLHYTKSEMALGHEGVGIVAAIGPKVSTLKVGDRAGWGFVKGSCGKCTECMGGNVYYCLNGADVYGKSSLDQGSFGDGIVLEENFFFKIPDTMASQHAAPLMCGGWTVWNALQGHGIKSSDSVGVVGIGGLGHLAIQFASKMGCMVTAFSATASKEREALSLGADHFVVTAGVKELVVPRTIDHLLIETNTHPDLNLFLPILSPRATIYPQQIPSGFPDWTIPFMSLLDKGHRIVFATAGPADQVSVMLDFAARNEVKPIVEMFPLNDEGIETSIQRLRGGRIRYRAVLAAQSS